MASDKVTKASLIFWGEFQNAASIPVDENVLDKALELQVMKFIGKNIKKFEKANGKFGTAAFFDSIKCARRCAYRAVQISKELGEDTVTAASYEKAFKEISGVVQKLAVRKAATNKNVGKSGRGQGLLCGEST